MKNFSPGQKKEAGQHMECYPAVYLNPTKPYIKY